LEKSQQCATAAVCLPAAAQHNACQQLENNKHHSLTAASNVSQQQIAAMLATPAASNLPWV